MRDYMLILFLITVPIFATTQDQKYSSSDVTISLMGGMVGSFSDLSHSDSDQYIDVNAGLIINIPLGKHFLSEVIFSKDYLFINYLNDIDLPTLFECLVGINYKILPTLSLLGGTGIYFIKEKNKDLDGSSDCVTSSSPLFTIGGFTGIAFYIMPQLSIRTTFHFPAFQMKLFYSSLNLAYEF